MHEIWEFYTHPYAELDSANANGKHHTIGGQITFINPHVVRDDMRNWVQQRGPP